MKKIFFLLLICSTVYPQIQNGTGLEKENFKILQVTIEDIQGDIVSKSKIKNKVELRLRQAGITPIEKDTSYFMDL